MDQTTINKLKGLIPDSVLEQIPDTAAKFNITTPLRLAHFLAQCALESEDFTAVKENLNYGEDRLLEIFKHEFDVNHDHVISDAEKLKAAQIAHKPEQIANFVYANRNGNGNEASGDGYKYSGRGYIQLTGRVNYAAFDKFVDDDILASPALVATKYPLMSAAFFFNSKNLWAICDQGSTDEVVKHVTLHVNGGTNGLDSRINYFKKFWNALKN
jgi:putative chitinase